VRIFREVSRGYLPNSETRHVATSLLPNIVVCSITSVPHELRSTRGTRRRRMPRRSWLAVLPASHTTDALPDTRDNLPQQRPCQELSASCPSGSRTGPRRAATSIQRAASRGVQDYQRQATSESPSSGPAPATVLARLKKRGSQRAVQSLTIGRTRATGIHRYTADAVDGHEGGPAAAPALEARQRPALHSVVSLMSTYGRRVTLGARSAYAGSISSTTPPGADPAQHPGA
jgi:hypothetical protein